ncbi:MAG TPA: hypothetical protein VE091_04150 [Gemmatimonadales bacterium]|nr:hypothetical protein [Gemmatimonadales bacterium]
MPLNPRRELPRPAIYLDSSVIRSAVSGDMRPRDRAAVCRLAAMVSENLMTFYAAAGARDEIDRIPPRCRAEYPREYAALQIFGAAPSGWLDAELVAPLGESPEYVTLRRILGEGCDAPSLFRARVAGVRDVVAAESSIVLERARELGAQLELRVFRPADYLSRWSTQLQLPG